MLKSSCKKYDLNGNETGEVEIEYGEEETFANSQSIKDYIVALSLQILKAGMSRTILEQSHILKKVLVERDRGFLERRSLRVVEEFIVLNLNSISMSELTEKRDKQQ